jgi:hypothetical protein
VKEHNSAATLHELPQVPCIMSVVAGQRLRCARPDPTRLQQVPRRSQQRGCDCAEADRRRNCGGDAQSVRPRRRMEQLHNRVKSEEADPEVATKMLTEGFLDAMRRSNEKELREFARIKFESFSAVGRKPN